MRPSESYEVRLTRAAVRQLRGFPKPDRARVAQSLRHQAAQSGASTGTRGGNSLKRIRGREDNFYRLRAGHLRIMFDLVHEERVLLVHGIVDRRDLERWLRGR